MRGFLVLLFILALNSCESRFKSHTGEISVGEYDSMYYAQDGLVIAYNDLEEEFSETELFEMSSFREDLKAVVVHCDATPPESGFRSAEHLNNFFFTVRDWSRPGYSYWIDRKGKLWSLWYNKLDCIVEPFEITNGVRGFNTETLHICLAGGINKQGKAENNFTPEQFSTLTTVLTIIKASCPAIEIKGHRDFSPDLNNDGIITEGEFVKQCPSFDVSEFVQDM